MQSANIMVHSKIDFVIKVNEDVEVYIVENYSGKYSNHPIKGQGRSLGNQRSFVQSKLKQIKQGLKRTI